MWDTTCQVSKLSYVFHSRDNVTIQQIDSLRTSIIDRYNHGTPFNKLSSIYTIHGNTSGKYRKQTNVQVLKDANEFPGLLMKMEIQQQLDLFE